MRLLTKTTFAAAAAAALLGRGAEAVTTRTWVSASYKELDEGEGEQVLISSIGEVTPGIATKRVEVESDALWSAVRGPDGTIYAGGVTDGVVWAITGDKPRKLVDLSQETPWIGALAMGPDGKLYVGTVASGAIHAVDPRSGKAEKVVTLPEAEHVWALTFDGKTLWAGTGPSAALFKVDVAARKAEKVWAASGEHHLQAVTRATDGALWIGTAEQALLYRYDPRSGQARAIADFAGTEVRAIVEADGAFVVATNEFEGGGASSRGARGTAAKPPEAGSTPGAAGTGNAEATPSRPGERKGKGAIFRVEQDGRIEQLHALSEAYLTSLTVVGRYVWAAAGAQGRIYRLDPVDRTVVTAFDVDERQVNAIIPAGDGVAFVTGDGAAVYVSQGPARDARYTSKVFDAQGPSRWGNLRWRGDANLAVETRSGNTAKPDGGWSAWQKLGGVGRTTGEASLGHVQSPAGRYLQFRVAFAGTGSMRGVTVYYLPQNQRARVTEVTVGESEGGSKAPVTTADGAAKPRSPIVKVKWKVENPDGDELSYRVELRPEGDAEWRRLMPTGSDPLTKAEIDWNTESLPDGYYRLRISASDGRVNPRDLALEHVLVSSPFLVDNQRPQVADLVVKAPWVSARAVDSSSRIDEIAWQIDGGDWRMAYPKDGIFDDLAEAFTFKLPDDLAPGTHTLQVRVADEADNIGAATVTFKTR